MLLLLRLGSAIIIAALFASANANIQKGDTCLNVISAIAPFDEKFENRWDQKMKLLANLKKDIHDKRKQWTPSKRIKDVIENLFNKKKNADDISKHIDDNIVLEATFNRCGATADWVADVLRGTSKDSMETGIEKNYAGEGITELFKKYARDKRKHHVFHLRFDSGTGAGHTWVVYQFPNTKNKDSTPLYQVFQSYVGAYTLEAWLTPITTDAGKLRERNKNIMPSWLTKCGQAGGKVAGCEGYYRFYTAIVAELTGELAALKELTAANSDEVRDWQGAIDFIKGTNANQPVESFEMAWKKYGGGQELTKADIWEGQATYATKLAKVIEWANEPADKPITTDDLNEYVGLFGARIISTYPGLPKYKYNEYDPNNPKAFAATLRIRVDTFKQKNMANVNKACVEEGLRIAGNLPM